MMKNMSDKELLEKTNEFESFLQEEKTKRRTKICGSMMMILTLNKTHILFVLELYIVTNSNGSIWLVGLDGS
jgi:hypothetical protein